MFGIFAKGLEVELLCETWLKFLFLSSSVEFRRFSIQTSKIMSKFVSKYFSLFFQVEDIPCYILCTLIYFENCSYNNLFGSLSYINFPSLFLFMQQYSLSTEIHFKY